MKSRKWVVLSLLMAALLAGGYGLYQRLTSSPPPVQGGETAVARRGNLVVTAAAFGSISLPQKVKLAFPTAGILTQLAVEVGNQVTQGEVLAWLDEVPLRQAVLQAQAGLKNAEIALKKVKEPYSQEDIARQRAAVAEAQRALEVARRELPIVQVTGENNVADAREALNKDRASVAEAQRALEVARQEVPIVQTSGEKGVADAREALAKAEAPYSLDDIAGAREAVAEAQRALGVARQEVAVVRASGEKGVADAREALAKAEAPYSLDDIAGAREAVAEAQRALAVARQEVAIVQTSGARSLADAQEALETELESYRQVMLRYIGRELSDGELWVDPKVYFFWVTELPQPLEDAYEALLKVKEERDLTQLQADKSLQAAQNGVARAEEGLRQAQVKLAKTVPDPQEVERAQRNLELAQLQADKSHQAAQNGVARAEEGLRQAQAQLAQVEAGQGVELARLQADKSLQAAQNGVARAEEGLRQAQAQLSEMVAGADPEEIALRELQVSQARLSLDEAEANLKAARLAASVSGVVAEVRAEVGDRVAAGAPVVVLVDPSRVEVSATVDEVDVARVRLGQPAAITLEAVPGARLRGQVKSISPVAQIQAGVVSYPVVISVLGVQGATSEGMAQRGMSRGMGQPRQPPAPSGPPTGEPGRVPLLGGMSASIEIVVEMKPDVLLVPSRAVRSVAGKQVVSVKAGEGVEERPVQVGGNDGRNTEIVSGLQEGETVVLPASVSPTPRPFGPGFGGGGMFR